MDCILIWKLAKKNISEFDSSKLLQMKKLMKEWDIDSSLSITGFNGFRDTLNSYLSPQNQKIFVFYLTKEWEMNLLKYLWKKIFI